VKKFLRFFAYFNFEVRGMMLAYDNQKQLIKAKEAEKGHGKFFCPGCQRPVMLKKGRHNLPHFAHYQSTCSTFSEGETEEHLVAKEMMYNWFINENIEMEAYLPKLKQRPDLLFGKTAIEIQCSPLSCERYLQRTQNYLRFNYSPWWILGKRLQPVPHQRWTQLQKACCRFSAELGFHLWLIDSEAQRVGLVHDVSWHYKFGTSFRTHYFYRAESHLNASITSIGAQNSSSFQRKWQPEAYRLWLIHKLVQQQKSILAIQGILYLSGGYLGNLPQWCYEPSVYHFLLEHRLLVLRYLFHQDPTQTFTQWVKQLKLIEWQWTFPLISQQELLWRIYQECSDFQKIQAF
jgi:competence protein CoiA